MSNAGNKEVRCNLKTILNEEKMSIRQLSEATGLTFETVRRLYHNTTVNYNKYSLAVICEVLNVELSELLTVEEAG